MSQKRTAQLGDLFNQYGEEHEQLRMEELRRARRQRIWSRVRKIAFSIVFFAALGTSLYYHREVTDTVAVVAKKLNIDMNGNAEAQTKGKVKDIQAEASKRADIIEATFK